MTDVELFVWYMINCILGFVWYNWPSDSSKALLLFSIFNNVYSASVVGSHTTGVASTMLLFRRCKQ
jgi:hypothetical protein